MKRQFYVIQRVQKCLSKQFCQYINGTKGVISLFLAILMVPFVSIAGVLINAARVNSAIAVFDEALCNASNSTLGTYDEFLKKRFGLLAMAQNTAAGGSGYSVQDLIAETFQFYMEQNLGALSNTYFNADTSAAGVYPLADTDVLLAEVMEYGKYTVPTKLVIDGLSLDSWLKKLTEGASQVGNVFNIGSSAMNVGTSFSTCQEKINKLKELLDTCETQNNTTQESFAGFDSAVFTYNEKVDEMKEEVAKCDQKVAEAEAALAAADEESRASAQAALDAAKQERQDTIDKYHQELIPLRNAVSEQKSDYVNTLTDLADAVLKAGEGTTAAQDSIDSVVNQGADLLKNVSTAVYEGKQSGIDKDIKEMEEKEKEASERGDGEAAYLWREQIAEKRQEKDQVGNDKTVLNAAISTGSEAASAINSFSQKKEEYKNDFRDLYSEIIEMRNDVRDKYEVVQEDERMQATSPYNKIFDLPLSASEVQDLLDNLSAEITNSSFLKVLKALVGFIKALFTLNVWADPELCSNISGSVNELPSHKTHSPSPFQDEDKQQSEYYKSIMGAYSTNGLNAGSVNGFEATIQGLMTDIDTISNAWDDVKWYNVLSKLATITKAIFSMGGHLISLMAQIQQVIATAVYEKLLLAGYIGYNIPNRTTYTGKGLTGASYNLPQALDGSGSVAFYGAEAEYIIMGDSSEITNQTLLFHIIYIIRLIINLPVVLANPEVQSIAAAAGAATFGIGTFVVYVVYCLAEPLMDTLILVNSGELPIFKTKAYLTPSGVVDLVGAFFKLKLSDDQKNEAYREVVGVMSGLGRDSEFAGSYADAVSAFGSGGESTLLKGFKIDYTQILIIIMLFINTESMLKRLGDVIQMEANYNSTGGIDAYQFDLSNSYTYLRASGKFSTNEFITLSDGSNLNSPERVVYRGY